MKHTPGEWPIVRDYCGRIESIGLLSANAETADDTDLHAWLEVNDADANLIAASPDLLAALQNLLRQVETRKNGATFSRDLARAAIAKATGVQQ